MSVTSVTEWKRFLLWGMAAGRCQYEACNQPLFYDRLTKFEFNSAYIAHIIADKPTGPRGDEVLSEQLKDELSNLMLLCDAHHRLVDRIQVKEHPVERLREMKAKHEQRIDLLASIKADRESHVLLYGARVGEHNVPVRYEKAAEAMVPDRFPATRQAIELGIKNTSLNDAEPEYWAEEVRHVQRQFKDNVAPRIRSGDVKHLSVFGLGPIPLLVELGRLLGDIQPAEVYQLHREPPNWKWGPSPKDFDYQLIPPNNNTDSKVVALVLSLSAKIAPPRVHAVLGENAAIWEVTHDSVDNDYLKGREQLGALRKAYRKALNAIHTNHGHDAELHVFPAVPVSAAVELGRVWMPKADLALVSPHVFPKYAKQAIEITDRKSDGTYSWGKSNPDGFADWFLDRQKVVFTKIAASRKRIILEAHRNIYAEIEDVPDQLVRTPLQRMVQVLKRHRDSRFSGRKDEADRPISIIITTLAAQTYGQEPDVFSAIARFLDHVGRYQETGLIKTNGEKWVIENPVNPNENFADRWNDEGSKKAEAFFQWIHWIREDMDDLLNTSSKKELDTTLRRAFGDSPGGSVAAKYTGMLPGAVLAPQSSFGRKVRQLLQFNVPHKKPPRWTIVPLCRVDLTARMERKGWRPTPIYSNGPPLPKSVKVQFEAHPELDKPYEVFWQVVNTGAEATRKNGLRGDFYDSSKTGRIRVESTEYTGTHWVEAFVVKKGVCVGRSGEFVVNIQ